MRMMRSPYNIPTKSNRRQISRTMSSDQMAAILHEHMSPVARITPRLSRPNQAGGLNRVDAARKPLTHNQLDDVVRTNNATNSTTVVRTAVIKVDESLNANNPIGRNSSNEEFCKMFSSWLEDTEQQWDGETFGRLKEDLWKLVGKYALATHKE